jgi:hypothetical protein
MKNPRGNYLMELLMCAMLVFALGAQGATSVGRTHTQSEFANPPPQQQLIAIIENPTIQIVNEPVAYIQTDRGVSVPLRGLMITRTTLNNENTRPEYLCSNNREATNLGLRSLSPASIIPQKETNGNILSNYLRGVNTRLDIGEITMAKATT